MSKTLLLDTDILIDYLRGVPAAIEFIEQLTTPLVVSAVTVGELYAAVREGEERRVLDVFTSAFDLIPLTGEIAALGGLIRRDYARSHNVGLADALIAATSISKQAPLVTLNRKHFPMLADALTPYLKP